MDKCKKCDKEFIKGKHKRASSFCSRSCANSRNFSEESRKKKSAAAKRYFAELTPERREKILNDLALLNKKTASLTKQTWLNKLISAEFDELGWGSKRKLVIHRQDYKCNRCGINDWQGEKISLEVDHINGIRTDDSRGNLEALCPNCHSITKTWRGRNKSGVRVTDEEILAAFQNCANIRQTLIYLGLAPRGGNYDRVKRIIGL